jgi:hypothetical protein
MATRVSVILSAPSRRGAFLVKFSMTENQKIPGRKRRSREEIKRLVLEFEASGLRANEFCRNHGLAWSTLQRQLKRRRVDKAEAKQGSRFVAVELARRESNGNSRPNSALEVVLSGVRRIEVRPGFDAPTLEGLIAVLERA